MDCYPCHFNLFFNFLSMFSLAVSHTDYLFQSGKIIGFLYNFWVCIRPGD